MTSSTQQTAPTKTVLIVEDNAGLRDLIGEYLTRHGLRVRVASDGLGGLSEVRHDPPDLVLLDLMMPRMDGLRFLQTYRTLSDAPVIVLTARDQEADKIAGLEAGADDYVTKPFSMAELLARVRAQLRRAEQPPTVRLLRHGPFVLNLSTRTLHHSGQPVELTRSEFDLLSTLMRVPGHVFSRLDLLQQLQDGILGSVRTIDVHIRHLRVKIEVDPTQPRWLETVFGVGYRFGGEQTP